jgi:lipoate-protein ligase A
MSAKDDPVQGPWDLDAQLIAKVAAEGGPRCAVYPHPTIAAVIGRGGDPWRETRPERLQAEGVPLLRRRGGGCAVVLDPGNLVCSIVLPLPGVGEITRSFARISAAVITALARIGIPDVAQEGTSDLAVGGRKLGGSCIWRTRGLVYYSTTLLVAPEWPLIDRYLPHPPREPEYRRGRTHRDFLICTADLGHPASPAELAAELGRELAPAVAANPMQD